MDLKDYIKIDLKVTIFRYKKNQSTYLYPGQYV